MDDAFRGFFAGGGQTLLASAFGGLTRWIVIDGRGFRDAVMAVICGTLAGHYLWPMILWFLGMEERPPTIGMAAFIAGTLGMSGVRAAAAIVEARARRLRDA